MDLRKKIESAKTPQVSVISIYRKDSLRRDKEIRGASP